jgi:hypothetical protein
MGWILITLIHRSQCPILPTIISLPFLHHQFWYPKCCFSAGKIWSNIWKASDIKLRMTQKQRNIGSMKRTLTSMNRGQKSPPFVSKETVSKLKPRNSLQLVQWWHVIHTEHTLSHFKTYILYKFTLWFPL